MSRVFKFHNDVDTDQIIASQYLLLPNIEEMKVYAFESIDPDFSKKVQEGAIVVAGEKFGCGSSREQAPSVLKALGVKAIVAKSFARIFYRNAINVGLPVLEIGDAVKAIKAGDVVEVDIAKGSIVDVTTGDTFQARPLPGFIQDIAAAGGLINYIKGAEAHE